MVLVGLIVTDTLAITVVCAAIVRSFTLRRDALETTGRLDDGRKKKTYIQG